MTVDLIRFGSLTGAAFKRWMEVSLAKGGELVCQKDTNTNALNIFTPHLPSPARGEGAGGGVYRESQVYRSFLQKRV